MQGERGTVEIPFLVRGHGGLLAKSVCGKRRRENGGDSGWLCLILKRSRTKDDDENEYSPRQKKARDKSLEATG